MSNQSESNYHNNKHHYFTYYLFKTILTPLAYLMYWPKIIGKEKIPKEGAVILGCNHRFAADPAFAALSTRRMVHFLAKKELFDSIFRWFFQLCGAIPVDRLHKDHRTMECAEDILMKGEVLGIYPEGTRNHTSEPIQPLKFGAVRLAQKTGAVIIPVIETGKMKPFLSRNTIYIGDPFYVESSADLNEANEQLRDIMINIYTTHNVEYNKSAD